MTSPKKILVDARPLVDPAGGGIPRVTQTLLEALVRTHEHIEWTFVTTGMHVAQIPEPFRSNPAVTHYHIRMPNKLWSALSVLGTISIDQYTAKKTKQHFDAALLPNIGFTGFLSIPYALVVHDLSFRIHPGWFSKKMQLWHLAVNPQLLAERAQRIFCVSETSARDTHTHFHIPYQRISIFRPNIHPAPQIPSPLPPSIQKPYALVLGGGDPRKNIRTAEQAIETLRNDPAYSNIQLVRVGMCHASRSFLSQNTKKEHDWIIHIPRPTDEELHALYENASVFLYPSWYEGFGLPLHETAQYGTPCIASSHGALPETAPEGTIFVPPFKPQLWTTALTQIIQHPERYKTSVHSAIFEPDLHSFHDWIYSLN